MTLSIGLATVAALALLAPSADAQILNRSVRRTGRRFGVILMLPVQVTLQGFTAPTAWKPGRPVPAAEQADQLGNDLYSALRDDLQSHGARVLPNPLAADSSGDLKYDIADLQRQYDVVETRILKRPLDIGKGRFTLGDEVAAFGLSAQVDTLVFVRGSGTIRLGREPYLVRNGVVKAKQPFEGRVTFVDARNGEVLAMVTVSTAEFGGWDGTAADLMVSIAKYFRREPTSIYSLLGLKPSASYRR